MIGTYQTFALGMNESSGLPLSATPNRSLCTAGDQYTMELDSDKLLSSNYWLSILFHRLHLIQSSHTHEIEL